MHLYQSPHVQQLAVEVISCIFSLIGAHQSDSIKPRSDSFSNSRLKPQHLYVFLIINKHFTINAYGPRAGTREQTQSFHLTNKIINNSVYNGGNKWLS